MIKQIFALAAAFGLATGIAARAQEKPAVVSTPLKVQVVIARYQGDKKIIARRRRSTVKRRSSRRQLFEGQTK